MKRARLAMISTGLRRDLQDPLRYFREIDVVHLYRFAWGDIARDELANTVRYGTPLDLYRKLQAARPDVVQGVEPQALMPLPYLLAGWRYARRHDCPLVVVSLENRPLSTKYGRPISLVLKVILRAYLQSARMIVYLNEGSRRNLEACGAPTDRMVHLMYGTWGVDVDEFSPSGVRHNEEGFGRTILFVGRLQRAKGVFDLISAFAIVARQFPDVGLLLVGEGAEKAALARQVSALRLDARVRFAGTVLNRDLPAYFRGASVFTCPSITTRDWEEQIGMANLQAMACGVPVVSSLSGAIPEYVANGTTGILVPEARPEELARAFIRLLADRDLATRLPAAGRAAAVERYSASTNVARVEREILARCIDAGVAR